METPADPVHAFGAEGGALLWSDLKSGPKDPKASHTSRRNRKRNLARRARNGKAEGGLETPAPQKAKGAAQFAAIWILSPGSTEWHVLQTIDFEEERRYAAPGQKVDYVAGARERLMDYRSTAAEGSLKGARIELVLSPRAPSDGVGAPPE